MRKASKSAQAHPVAKSKAHEKARAGVLPHSSKKTTAAAATTSVRRDSRQPYQHHTGQRATQLALKV